MMVFLVVLYHSVTDMYRKFGEKAHNNKKVLCAGGKPCIKINLVLEICKQGVYTDMGSGKKLAHKKQRNKGENLPWDVFTVMNIMKGAKT